MLLQYGNMKDYNPRPSLVYINKQMPSLEISNKISQSKHKLQNISDIWYGCLGRATDHISEISQKWKKIPGHKQYGSSSVPVLNEQ
jgi:hypothetical protein